MVCVLLLKSFEICIFDSYLMFRSILYSIGRFGSVFELEQGARLQGI
jgi:alpha-D-ribose 1-methylphosphonate 5-triphosphate synthase subunit PhnH